MVCARDAASFYVWRKRTIEFYHCKTCGCLTHYERAKKRSDSTVAVNARMMEPEAIGEGSIKAIQGSSCLSSLAV